MPVHSRNQSLDILCCIAILLVLGHHFIHYHHWAKVGWIGVDLFFVLSGFLISGLLFSEYKRNGQSDIQRFILRRGRVLPLHQRACCGNKSRNER